MGKKFTGHDLDKTYALSGNDLILASMLAGGLELTSNRDEVLSLKHELQTVLGRAVAIDPDVITRPESAGDALVRSTDLLKRLFKDGHDAATREPDQLSGDAWQEYMARHVSTACGRELAHAATAIAKGSQPGRERAMDTRAKLRAVIESGIAAVTELLDTRSEGGRGRWVRVNQAIDYLGTWAETASECLNAEQREHREDKPESWSDEQWRTWNAAADAALSSQTHDPYTSGDDTDLDPATAAQYRRDRIADDFPFTQDELCHIITALEDVDDLSIRAPIHYELAEKIRAMLPASKVDNDSYTIVVEFTRSLSSDTEVCERTHRTLEGQLILELQEAMDDGYLSGEFSVIRDSRGRKVR